MQQPILSADHHTTGIAWKSRARAAGIHLALSCAVALLAALLVFAVWYPYPYREVSGGRELFLLIVSVDVALGPLITFAVFNRAKPRTELRRDLCIVGLLQVAALAYGLWTVNLARPVHMVFEIDRFRVVHQIDVPVDLLDRAPPGIDPAPLSGPTLLSLRPFKSENEKVDATIAALGGVQLGSRPDLWQSYEAGRADVLRAAKPVAQLKQRFATRAPEIDAAVRATGRSEAQTVYLPMIARKEQAWTVLLDAGTAAVLGYIPLDSF
jgi:hypothetical protein